MAEVELKNIVKRFGDIEVVKNLSLKVRDKEFFCLLGYPSAGKTTILRIIAGLERPDEGEVYIGGELVNDVYAGDRDVAMVFQNLALYSHLKVYDNLAFPLRKKKVPKSEIRERVHEIAKTLKIDHLLDRKNLGTLSGGEQQRVAVGRALIRKPKAFLLDEPLANMDALLRVGMRLELRRLQREFGQTIIYATPDELEAMTMGDRIALLDRGVLQQCDTPHAIYNKPVNIFTATYIGSPTMNLIDCTLIEKDGKAFLDADAFTIDVTELKDKIKERSRGSDLMFGIRPEDIQVSDRQASEESVKAFVDLIEPRGPNTVIRLKADSVPIRVITSATFRPSLGEEKWLDFNTDRMHIFDRKTGKALIQ